MFTLNDDLSIYATRGDAVFFSVMAEYNGETFQFQAGDVVRFKVYGKKNAKEVLLQKDFPITAATDSVAIVLTEAETKLGDVISKPTDYWYEVELNPFTDPKTIIGYDEDGAKIFKLFPEGADVPEFVVKPEDVPVVDKDLDLTSTRPVQNQAIARAVVQLRAGYEKTDAQTKETANDLAVERARISNLVAGTTPSGAEVVDVRVDMCGVTHESAGDAVREHFKHLAKVITGITYIDGTYITAKGKENALGNAMSSDYVDISDYVGENLLLYSCLFDSAGFAIYDKNKVCIAGVAGNDCAVNPIYGYYRVSLPINAYYIRFSVLKSKMAEGKVIILPGHTGTKTVCDIIDANTYKVIALDDVEYTASHCIRGKNGDVVALDEGHPLQASGFVDISGYGLYDLYISCVFSGYAGMAFYDKNGRYIDGHSGDSFGASADHPVEVVVKTPANAKYIRYTIHEGYEGYSIRFRENAGNIVEKIKTHADYSFAVEKVLCIGDSLTSGANYISKNGSSIQQNFPYYLGRMLNCYVTNAGKSGWSASNWYQNYGEKYNYAEYDAFVIWLGTNYGCGTMPTDNAINAFVPDANVADADANQALYLIRIIKDIQAANSDAFIVLCNTFASKSDVQTHNATIEEIAAKYGLMLLDMSDLSADIYPELHGGISNPHFGKAGNIYIADRIKTNISEYIAENPLRAEFGYTSRTN